LWYKKRRRKSMERIREVALQAVKAAGVLLKQRFGEEQIIHFKGEIDIVTEMDQKSEALIRETILREFPDHSILGEEKGWHEGRAQYRWIIDPLDGTTNYAHGFPFFAVAVAVEKGGEIIYGIVYDPLREELFEAERGGGAFLNGRRIHVSDVKELTKALLATGFPYDIRKGGEDNIVHFVNFLKVAQAVRRPGSACLDLCYVANGRFDGFWEPKLHPWDMAAGSVIVQEAGGTITDFRGGRFNVYSQEVVASNGLLHEAMLQIIAQGLD